MTRIYLAALVGAIVAHVVVENGAGRGVLFVVGALGLTLTVDGLAALVRLARRQLASGGSPAWTRPDTKKSPLT
jgi:hypothetical protein